MTQRHLRIVLTLLVATGLLACTGAVQVTGNYPVVQSTVTTAPCRSAGDNCDDSAIWIHPNDPGKSLVIGDDKRGGLLVWNLEGVEMQFIDGDKYMNNLDLRYEFPLTGTFSTGHAHTRVALVAVTNETDSGVTVYKVNPHSSPAGRLEHANGTLAASTLPLAQPLVYGGCLYYSQPTGKYYFFANWKDGTVTQLELAGGSSVTGQTVRTFDVGGQVEGCVADDVLQSLYVGEEEVGIWKYGAEPATGSSREQVDSVGSPSGLKADVEGLSLYYRNNGSGYLIVSGQSDGQDVRYVVYERGGKNQWLGTFRVQGVDATDGLDVTNFPLGAGFPHGVFVTHDASPTPSRQVLTPFDRAATALNLTTDSTWDPRCSPYGTCGGGSAAATPAAPSSGASAPTP